MMNATSFKCDDEYIETYTGGGGLRMIKVIYFLIVKKLWNIYKGIVGRRYIYFLCEIWVRKERNVLNKDVIVHFYHLTVGLL